MSQQPINPEAVESQLRALLGTLPEFNLAVAHLEDMQPATRPATREQLSGPLLAHMWRVLDHLDPKTKFTFRKVKVGPWDKDRTTVKVRGLVAGELYEGSAGLWRARFMVLKNHLEEDGNTSCLWRNVTLRETFNCETAARDHLQDQEFKNHFLRKFILWGMEPTGEGITLNHTPTPC